MSTPRIGVIVVAAGGGARLGGEIPKPWRLLSGIPLVERSWRTFLPDSLRAHSQNSMSEVRVLVAAQDRQDAARRLADAGSTPAIVAVGGATRMDSVRAGLAALPATADLVAVHDAARPFWPVAMWDELIETLIAKIPRKGDHDRFDN